MTPNMPHAMGEQAFRAENGQLRDIGLSLSGARDRHVLLETVDKLERAGLLGRKGLAETLRQTIAAAKLSQVILPAQLVKH